MMLIAMNGFKTLRFFAGSYSLLALFALGPAVTLTSLAQTTYYVSDQVEIPLRAGTSTRFRIIRMLPSGTPLTLIDQDSASGYSQVRTDNGTQGWILSRYLLDQPVARDQIQQLQQSLASMQTENQQLREQMTLLQQQRNASETRLQQTDNDNQRLSQDLTQIRKTAANAIAIDERNKLLEQQTVELERRLQILQQENQALADTSNQGWFLRGAGVLFFGLLLGLIVPQFRMRKSARWSDL
jgi:SH3 domain protein